MSRVIRPPDAWGQSVVACPKTGVPYLVREVSADWGRAWAVSKLAGRRGYSVHLSDAGVLECECKAFLSDDHCKHARMVLDVLHEEGESVNPDLPPGWKDHPMKPGLPPPPPQIKALPVCPVRKLPVPWFVAWVDGKPDFRVADPRKVVLAVREKRCWVCGMGLAPGPHTFVSGPYCAFNYTTAEPPCHHQCAVYAATACPFLTKPHMTRREEVIPGTFMHGGYADNHNPGVTALVVSSVLQVKAAPNGIIFGVGRPHRFEWYAEGRPATRDEVKRAMDEAAAKLLAFSKAEEARFPGSTLQTERDIEVAWKWLPPVPPPPITPAQAANAGAT